MHIITFAIHNQDSYTALLDNKNNTDFFANQNFIQTQLLMSNASELVQWKPGAQLELGSASLAQISPVATEPC